MLPAGKTKIMVKESEVRGILRDFGIDNPGKISEGGGTASPKYIFTSSGKKYLLKQRRREFSPLPVVLFDHSVIKHLSRNGLPVAIPSYSAKTGCELFEYIENLEDFTQGNREEMSGAAEMLGRMHRILHDFVPEGSKNWQREFLPSGIKAELLKHIEEQPGLFHGKETVRLVMELLDGLIENYSVKNLTRSIVHGDYTSANVKFKGNLVGGIFDFDWTSLQNTLYDISRALVYFCFKRKNALDGKNIWSLVQPCEIDIENVRQFMKSYRREFIFTQADAEGLHFALKEFFIGARVRAMRKVPDAEKIKMLDEKLVEMAITVEKEKNSLAQACG